MSEKRNSSRLIWWLASVAVLAAIAVAILLMPSTAAAPTDDPPFQAVDAAKEGVVAENCELLQTLTYTRCEHVVTRRVAAPVELYGKTLADVEALYPEWRITEFSPSLIKMEQQPDLFCPDHVVLMPDGAGVLCVFENKYGDALALVTELTLTLDALPASLQEEARHGIGFSSLADLEQWLESVES